MAGTPGKKLKVPSRVPDVEELLSQETLEIVRSNPDILRSELAQRKRWFPSKDFVPNIAQERGLLGYARKHSTYNDYPFITIFRAGNGVGKTCAMSLFLAGVTLGPDFINKEFFNFNYYRDCENVRRQRPLMVRIVCDGQDMSETGSAYQEIRKWIPKAQFKDRTGGYFNQIVIPAPSSEFFETVIDVKTHGMSVVAHAGPTYDLILFNEPPPQDIWNENIGRCRGGGRIAAFLTPLNMAGYLYGIANTAPEGEIYETEASIWDNCADIPGTRGTLSRRDIEKMIRQWQQNNPLEVPARRDGKFMHLAGAIFQSWSRKVHVVDPFPLDPSWNYYMVIDPHDRKPPFVVWLARSPMNFTYVIAEYPLQPWNHITGTQLTIRDFAWEFKRIEMGAHDRFPYFRNVQVSNDRRHGDRRKMADRQPNTGMTMQQEYEKGTGFSFNCHLNSDVTMEHEKVRGLLQYNPESPIGPMNTPHLFVFKTCVNVIAAFENYSYAKNQGLGAGISDKIDETWRCPMACVGYYALAADDWRPNGQGSEFTDDYNEILRGRSGSVQSEIDSYSDETEAAYAGGRFV